MRSMAMARGPRIATTQDMGRERNRDAWSEKEMAMVFGRTSANTITRIDMITVAPYARFTAWADTPWRKRGRDYLDYKERLSQRLIEILFAQLPQLRGKIDHYELSTPLSTQTFVNHGAGQVYGLAHTPQRFAQTWLRPGTALEGFYLTGQDVMTCGVAGAMLGGVATFSHVAGLGGMKVLAQVFR